MLTPAQREAKGDGWFHGERLQCAREFRGLSITGLAVKMRVTAYRIRLWESDEERPNAEELHRLASVLYFMTGFFLKKSDALFTNEFICGSGGCEIYNGPQRTQSPRRGGTR